MENGDMSKPGLQVALDFTALSPALNAAALLAPHVDILEAGTILCLAEGMSAVRQLRKAHPDQTLVADLKVADAGETLAGLAFAAGTDWMTVICAAPLGTMEKSLEIARAHDGDIQIELFGSWTLDDARQWRGLGLVQAIYHRGRDVKGPGWGPKDLDTLKALSDLGFEVSVTGGVTSDDLPLFRDIAVKTFIAGRALYGAADPVAAAQSFRQAIDAVWGGR
jgi:3-dehydro-L-gulonate-6-phosphate decarboxylase